MKSESATPFGLSNDRHRRLFLCAVGLAWLVALPAAGLSQTFQELHAFMCRWDDNTGWDCTNEGAGPKCALVQGRDGNFYGTTSGGGRWGCGTIFRISPEGEFTTLAHFDGTNGNVPYGALLEVGNGVFYGTTKYRFGNGNFFRFTLTGGITDLPPAPGVYPLGDLAKGPDGNLYGVAEGARGYGIPGSIFVASTNGPLRTLHMFSGNDSFAPSGGLLLASDGYFYGVTAGGGAWGGGTVYRISTSGEFSTVASLLHWVDNAESPNGRLVEAPNGSLYGTADSAGHVGAIFRVTKDGILTTVAAGVNQYPRGPLVLARDGNFYGCTYAGGDYCCPAMGQIFKITPQGTLSTVLSFTGFGGAYSGAHPYAGPLQGGDGNLYGTTWEGGAIGGGNVYRIIMPGNECRLSCSTNTTVCNDRGQCGATVSFGPPVTTNCAGYVVTANPASGSFFPIGTNTVTWTAVDSASGQLTNTCTFTVIVHDCESPVIHNIAAIPASLGPPNHKMQPVTLRVSATDNCHIERSRIISVSCNEAGASDWEITGDMTVNLRAESRGRGSNDVGRVYNITVECADDSGNTSTKSVRIGVSR
jgi:uncharacterized repeat protein (TIGR03803 family)